MTAPVRWSGSDLVIDFSTGVEIDVVEGVLDLDDSGEPIGLEVLGIIGAHPGLMSTGDDQASFPQVVVDAEADAIYIRFSRGRSLDQVVRPVAIAFDRSDRIVGAVVRMEL